MLDQFAKQIMHTLLSEMQAVDSDGAIDHRTRMAALKEARSFVKDIIPRLTKEDREEFSHAIREELDSKLKAMLDDEKKVAEIKDTL